MRFPKLSKGQTYTVTSGKYGTVTYEVTHDEQPVSQIVREIVEPSDLTHIDILERAHLISDHARMSEQSSGLAIVKDGKIISFQDGYIILHTDKSTGMVAKVKEINYIGLRSAEEQIELDNREQSLSF